MSHRMVSSTWAAASACAGGVTHIDVELISLTLHMAVKVDNTWHAKQASSVTRPVAVALSTCCTTARSCDHKHELYRTAV
jgi:hypothetical protein